MTQPNPYPSNPPGKFPRGLIAWIIFVAVAVTAVFLMWRHNVREISMDEFRTELSANNVSEFVVSGNEINGRLKLATGSGVAFHAHFNKEDEEIATWLRDHKGNANMKVVNESSTLMNLILPLAPWLVIFGFVWFFLYRKVRNQQRQAM